MINYIDSLNDISPSMLKGFFVEFSKKPSAGKLYDILENSEYKLLAIDSEQNKVVGFINAISDHTLAAYIPLLEVLPDYQKRGIGKELVGRMLKKLEGYYMIDLCCDEGLAGFYSKFGMKRALAMVTRNYHNQAGKQVPSQRLKPA